MRRIVSWMIFALLLVGTFALAFDVGLVRAQLEAVIINSDGSVSPSSAPILNLDNITYTFTGNMSYPAYNGVAVERNNIVIDGDGYALQTNGTESGYGVYLASCVNVTVRNMQVTAFGTGINLYHCTNCTVSGNSLTSNSNGIIVDDSSYNNISSNNITANQIGIWFNVAGIQKYNKIYHNNFIQNSNQVYEVQDWDIWDDGYPAGGNYWSDYNGTDLYGGQFQNESGSDGIGDSPYNIIFVFQHMGTYYYVMGQDHYPLTIPFGSNLPLGYPVARFTYAPLQPVVNQTVVFNASTSTCTKGTIIHYEWDFGDGENGTGQTVSHAYSENGNYNVTLTTISNTRIPDAENQTINVRQRPLPLWELLTLVVGGSATIVVASLAVFLAAKRYKHKKSIKTRSHLDAYLSASIFVRADS